MNSSKEIEELEEEKVFCLLNEFEDFSVFVTDKSLLELDKDKQIRKGEVESGDFVTIKKGNDGLFEILPLEREEEGRELEVISGFKSTGVVPLRERAGITEVLLIKTEIRTFKYFVTKVRHYLLRLKESSSPSSSSSSSSSSFPSLSSLEQTIFDEAKKSISTWRRSQLMDILEWKWKLELIRKEIREDIVNNLHLCFDSFKKKLQAIFRKEKQRRERNRNHQQDLFGWLLPSGRPSPNKELTPQQLFIDAKQRLADKFGDGVEIASDASFFELSKKEKYTKQQTRIFESKSIFFVSWDISKENIQLREDYVRVEWVKVDQFFSGIGSQGRYRAFCKYGAQPSWENHLRKAIEDHQQQQQHNQEQDILSGISRLSIQ